MLAVTRRSLLSAPAVGAAAFAIGNGALAGLAAAQGAAPRSRLFSVGWRGNKIGEHSIQFEQRGDSLAVDIDIDLEVKVAFVTAYRYQHVNRELWRDGTVQTVASDTNDNGSRYRLEAIRMGQGLRVDGNDGEFTAPSDTVPTSYWNASTLGASHFLDTQKGRLFTAHADNLGREVVEASGQSIPAEKYDISGDLNLSIWYDTVSSEWVKLEFLARGEHLIEYTLM